MDPYIVTREGPGLGGGTVAFGDGVSVMEAILNVPYTLLSAILTDLITAATGAYDGTVVRLFTGATDPGKATVVGDFTEATFTGYAASSAVVWSAVMVSPDGYPQAIGGSKTFIATAGVPAEVITGYYLTDAAGTEYRGGARFPEGIPVSNAGNFVHVTPVLELGNLSGN